MKDNFWNDERVIEYFEWLPKPPISISTIISCMETFKQSKQQYINDKDVIVGLTIEYQTNENWDKAGHRTFITNVNRVNNKITFSDTLNISIDGFIEAINTGRFKIVNPKQPPITQEKPPLGLKPEFIHKEQRLQEIRDALNRFNDHYKFTKEAPKEWIEEKHELEAWLIEHKKSITQENKPTPKNNCKDLNALLIGGLDAYENKEKKDYEIVAYDGYRFVGELSKEQLGVPCRIKSVRRLSDNSDWSVGDKVKVTSKIVSAWDRNPVHEIYAFGLNDDKSLFVCLKTNTPVCGDIETGKKTNSYMQGVFAINDFIKAPNPLFYTDDTIPVSIYPKDKYFFVVNFQVSKEQIAYISCTYGDREDIKYFATEQSANSYIFHKKICMCYDDVVNVLTKFENLSAEVLFPNYETKLEQLVKQKIKQ